MYLQDLPTLYYNVHGLIDIVDMGAFSGRSRASTQDPHMPAGTFMIKPMYTTEVALKHRSVAHVWCWCIQLDGNTNLLSSSIVQLGLFITDSFHSACVTLCIPSVVASWPIACIGISSEKSTTDGKSTLPSFVYNGNNNICN
jgi:hypothetical protein